MSRHRNIRNIRLEDIEYGYEEEDDRNNMTEKQKAQMKEGKRKVRAVIGQLGNVTDKEIEDTLWDYYFDSTETISRLLEKDQARKRRKEAASNKDLSKKNFPFNEPSPGDKIQVPGASKGKQVATKTTKTTTSSTSEKSSVSEPSVMINKVKTCSSITQKDATDEIIEEEEDVQLKFDMDALRLVDPIGSSKASSEIPFSSMVATLDNQESPPPQLQPNVPRTPKVNSNKAKRIDVVKEYKKRTADKLPLNLVIVGHVDAGKSTLMGHFLYLLGEVNEKTMKGYERDSSKIGKSSFSYAWVLDETDEERRRGITMDIAITKFETKNRRFTLLDAPGHRDFIPNMISGAAQADVAILVVDATTGEFEAGFDANGQTKEHALLVRSLGVQQLVVAVNKLDVVGWSKARHDEIVAKLSSFLCSINFKKEKVFYVPCSGLTGENLIKKPSTILDWYSGLTLIQQIDLFEPPARLLEKPFRLSVSDFFKGGIGSSGGVTVAGRIEAGAIQVGEEIMAVPGGERGVVKALEIGDVSSKWAAAGDSVLLTLIGLDIIQLKVGSVLCPPSNPVHVTSHLRAQIVVFDVKIPITKGFPVILHRQSINEPANVTKLVSIVDKSTGAVVKKNPRHIPKSTTAIVEIKLTNRAIPFETFKENKEFGRIMLRKGGETIAAGVVQEILSFGS